MSPLAMGMAHSCPASLGSAPTGPWSGGAQARPQLRKVYACWIFNKSFWWQTWYCCRLPTPVSSFCCCPGRGVCGRGPDGAQASWDGAGARGFSASGGRCERAVWGGLRGRKTGRLCPNWPCHPPPCSLPAATMGQAAALPPWASPRLPCWEGPGP